MKIRSQLQLGGRGATSLLESRFMSFDLHLYRRTHLLSCSEVSRGLVHEHDARDRAWPPAVRGPTGAASLPFPAAHVVAPVLGEAGLGQGPAASGAPRSQLFPRPPPGLGPQGSPARGRFTPRRAVLMHAGLSGGRRGK